MSKRLLSIVPLLTLGACSASPSGESVSAVTTCDYDGAGGGCPGPSPKPAKDKPVQYSCVSDYDSIPDGWDVARWDWTQQPTLWPDQTHGVLSFFYEPGSSKRVEVFGVDLANAQIRFHLFANVADVWPAPGALQKMSGTDPQITHASGLPIDQGQASAGDPPGGPPTGGGGGPICPDAPCPPSPSCTTGVIFLDALHRVTP